MTRIQRTTLGFFAIAMLSAPAVAEAKIYNQSPFLPSLQQSKVNRVQAGITATASQTGKNGVFEQDCNESDASQTSNSPIQASNGALRVGAFDNHQQQAREQIIVAKDIINVGGQCRVRR